MSLLLIYIVVIGGVFIFMTSRGNRKRQTQAQMLQSGLVVGAEVRTIGGMVGEVVEVTDEHVVIETTPGVQLKFVKSAVAGVIPPAEPESEDGDSEDTESEDTDSAETEPADELEHDEDGIAAQAEAGKVEPSDAAPTAEEQDDDAAHHVESEPANR